MRLSNKGTELISLYKEMVDKGYKTSSGSDVQEDAFGDFELRAYREQLKKDMKKFNLKTLLDYGCGGSDWSLKDFNGDGKSAKEYFGLKECYRYEPSRDLDERQKVDCVVNFDVLEHVFVADVPKVIDNIFSYAKKLVIINVACYPAKALLPNGENAHITVRHPIWWKSQVDFAALNYPEVSVLLLTSQAWRKTSAFSMYKASNWLNSNKFVIDE